MSTIKIVIADAQPLFRDGLKWMLKETKDIDVVAEVDHREQLVGSIQHHNPDIIIIDYNLPNYFTYQDIKDILSQFPGSKILILSSDSDTSTIYKVLEFGVNSYLTKECSKKEIIRAIYATAKGEKCFCNKVVEVLLENKINSHKPSCEPGILSVREMEIMSHIGTGKSTKEVAADLFISIHTVRTHRKNIMKKVGVNSTPELVLYAVHAGLTLPKTDYLYPICGRSYSHEVRAKYTT